MKDDERRFLRELQMHTRTEELPSPRALAASLGIHEKRAAYICEKWTGKRWYDYGVNVLAGWLTPEGLAVDSDKAA